MSALVKIAKKNYNAKNTSPKERERGEEGRERERERERERKREWNAERQGWQKTEGT